MKRQKSVVDLVKVAFIVMTVKVMASTSIIMPWNPIVDNFCILFAIFVMLVKLFRLTLSLDKVIILVGISLFTLYSCITIKQYELLISLIAIFLLINVDMDEYLSLMYKVQVFIIMAHFAISCVWSLFGGESYFWSTVDNRLRFNGGFVHSNVLSCYIVSCMLMFTWKRFKQITSNEFGYMAIITALSYIMTKSRTGLLLNIILLLTIFLTQKENRLVVKVINRTLMLIFPALSAAVFWMQQNYLTGNSVILFLDNLMSRRLKYAAYAYMRSGITWLPRYLDYAAEGIIPWTPEWNLNTFTFDNIYSFFLIQMGLVWIGIFTVVIAVVSRKCEFKVKIYFLIWVLFAMVEVHGINCFKFFPLLLLSTLLSEKGVEVYRSSKN